jgi:hypothetical protein
MAARTFSLPRGLSSGQQVSFCLQIIEKQRQELFPLRNKIRQCHTRHDPLIHQLKEWREKYKKSEEENGLLKKENEHLKKEKDKLKQEIEKLTKTNNRYQIALFDHGNFKHPGEKDNKLKGGQTGHRDTNREKQENYASYGRKRVFAKTCGKCGSSLKRTKSIRKKILLDIVINPEIVKLIIESERQWCSNCQKEVSAKDPQTLPFTEYGINTFMLSMLLRFKAHASFSNIAAVMTISHGLTLSKSDVSNLLKKGAGFLGKRYGELKEAVKRGEVMYNDETGWLVHGQKAWMWIMSSSDKKLADGTIESGITVYIAAESRGKGIFEEMYGNSDAVSMHDGYAGYESVTGEEKTAYCWTHILRFAYEETIGLEQKHLACRIRDKLVDLYRTIRRNRQWTKKHKEKVLRVELDNLIRIQSSDQTVKNILHRISTQKEGLILALLVTEDGTNNLSERELRNMAIKRSISNGSDTYKGMETTAVIGSALQTLHRNKKLPFFPTLQNYLRLGVKEKYHQYMHTPYCDS